MAARSKLPANLMLERPLQLVFPMRLLAEQKLRQKNKKFSHSPRESGDGYTFFGVSSKNGAVRRLCSRSLVNNSWLAVKKIIVIALETTS